MDNLTSVTATRLVGKALRDIRPLFYLELPSTSSYRHVTDVPDYLKQVTPYFFVMIFLEVFIRWMKGMPAVRFNDSINSLSAGLWLLLVKIILGGLDITLYVWGYDKFCVYELPWDSPITWVFALLGVDCCYYWFHRAAHEVNIFWAAHQVHHSSEDYTLSTALRQSCAQIFTSMFVYLPLALVLPPSVYFTHKQFNLLYQFWIHTEVVDNMGILEWVLNTPSHHRVHHGRNPYCIDCNYAGVLIIWDRMFGTFQPELREEKVIYGLVHPLGTWNPFWAQIHHYLYILKRLVMGEKGEGLMFKLQFLFKGPGWTPGKPRLGLREDIPQVPPDTKPYDRRVPTWLKVYVGLQFATTLIITRVIAEIHKNLHLAMTWVLVLFCLFSITCHGLFLDHHPLSVPLEIFRLTLLLMALTQTSAVFVGASSVSPVFSHPIILQVLVGASLSLWAYMWLSGRHKTINSGCKTE